MNARYTTHNPGTTNYYADLGVRAEVRDKAVAALDEMLEVLTAQEIVALGESEGTDGIASLLLASASFSFEVGRNEAARHLALRADNACTDSGWATPSFRFDTAAQG